MPRNRADRSDVLTREIKTRVNEQKYKELNVLLSKTHYRTMSELIRNILYNRPIKTFVVDETFENEMEELSGIRKELKAIGININQITRDFNTSDSASQRLMQTLRVAEQYKAVERKVETLLVIISKLSDKWLQR